MAEDIDCQLEDTINDSGFPLQIGLEQQASGVHWKVVASEFPWLDPLAAEGKREKFIDVVLHGKIALTLVIECKRARNTDWIFLREPRNKDRSLTRALVVILPAGQQQATRDWVGGLQCLPTSSIGKYCVIRKNGQRSEELLERLAAETVRAAEAVADQEISLMKASGKHLGRVYFPVIVTTAAMYVSEADYADVDLDVGEVSSGSTKYEPVKCVRFVKSFGVGGPPQAAADIEDLVEQTERCVFVVSASAVLEFLEKLELSMRTSPSLLAALYGR